MTAIAPLLVTLAALLSMAGGSPWVGVWPLDPRPAVVRGFDPPATTWGAGHRGVDLLGHRGQPVLAALAGRITFAGRLAGRGVVVVDHGDLHTTYQPVASDVHVGDHVARGQWIGTLQLGASHCFPGACLHWGLLRGDTYLDPLVLIGGGPVRLLPLAGAPPAGSGPSPVRSLLDHTRPAVGAGPGARVALRVGLPRS
ncbi:MAG: peptidoglycan DD-metalloendopeptidase family protein [Marmoricola sp.]